MTTLPTSTQRIVDDDSWYDQPMRWLQLNLVRDDALHTDVTMWKDYWRDARVDGLTISAAGATAQYPTDVPLHERSPFLGDRDLFGELVAAAKELGIRVLARFEALFTSHELAAAHPDWMANRVGGAHPELPGLDSKASRAIIESFTAGRPSPCFNGPYFREFMPEVMTELATRYPIDGFYANGWPMIGGGPPGPSAACTCPTCLEGWRARGHDEYPTKVDPSDPLWTDFVTYQQECYERVQREWQEHVKAIRPGLSFVCNLHGSLASGVRWQEFGPMVDLFANDSQGRLTLEPRTPGAASEALWGAARSAAVLHALADGKPTCHIVGAWHAGGPPLRRLAKEPLEIRLMLAQVVSRGARPWCNVAGGNIYDRRWMSEVSNYYRWHAATEPYLRNLESLADVGIVWTPRAVWAEWSDRAHAGSGPSLPLAFHGWQETLLRSRQPFDIVPAFKIADVDLSRYRALIVPSGSALDQREAGVLRAYAEAGGGLVLGCGALSQPREGGPAASLAAVAGVEVPPEPRGPHFSAYIDVAGSAGDPLLKGVGDTDYLPAGQWIARPPGAVGAVGIGRFQPPLPFLADLAYVEAPPADDPVLTRNGRHVMLASDLDALHGSNQLPDLRTVLANAIRIAAGDTAAAVSVEGPGIVAVHPWRQATSRTVHLVNYTNPQLYGGPVDDLYPVGPFTATIRLDPAEPVGTVELLRHQRAAQWRRNSDGSVAVEVPEIVDFEVIAIEEPQA